MMALHGAHLYVFGGDGETLHLLDFDREADAPAIRIPNCKIRTKSRSRAHRGDTEASIFRTLPFEQADHKPAATWDYAFHRGLTQRKLAASFVAPVPL